MFERFDDGARQVVALAEEEARVFRHDYIGTEHILLGLVREEDGLAARVLESLGADLEGVRLGVARIVGRGKQEATGQFPFTPRVLKAFELALGEALSLGHAAVGTEHVLLGLVGENQGVAVRILLDFDADAGVVRDEIFRMRAEPERPLDGGLGAIAGR